MTLDICVTIIVTHSKEKVIEMSLTAEEKEYYRESIEANLLDGVEIISVQGGERWIWLYADYWSGYRSPEPTYTFESLESCRNNALYTMRNSTKLQYAKNVASDELAFKRKEDKEAKIKEEREQRLKEVKTIRSLSVSEGKTVVAAGLVEGFIYDIYSAKNKFFICDKGNSKNEAKRLGIELKEGEGLKEIESSSAYDYGLNNVNDIIKNGETWSINQKT